MIEIIGGFPFMLSPVEAFLGFFSRIKSNSLTFGLLPCFRNSGNVEVWPDSTRDRQIVSV